MVTTMQPCRSPTSTTASRPTTTSSTPTAGTRRSHTKPKRSTLRPDGLLVISIRDYDKALVDHPATAPPLVIDGPPRRLFVRLHDWDAPDSALYTVRFFVLTETDAGDWTLAHHATRYRAITRDALAHLARGAGFDRTQWLSPERFHQPVMIARPTVAPRRRPSAHDPACRP